MEYIVKENKTCYDVYLVDGKDEILTKIYESIIEVETYIILKNGIIKEFIAYDGIKNA